MHGFQCLENDILRVTTNSFEECVETCLDHSECGAISFDEGLNLDNCNLKPSCNVVQKTSAVEHKSAFKNQLHTDGAQYEVYEWKDCVGNDIWSDWRPSIVECIQDCETTSDCEAITFTDDKICWWKTECQMQDYTGVDFYSMKSAIKTSGWKDGGRCVCKPGHSLQSFGFWSECVPDSQCHSCPPFATYSKCMDITFQVCPDQVCHPADIDAIIPILLCRESFKDVLDCAKNPLHMRQGCQCDPGYVYHETINNGKPGCAPCDLETFECPEGEHYADCANECLDQNSCPADSDLNCPLICSPMCVCNQGKSRNPITGLCEACECANCVTEPSVCGLNQHFNECGSECSDRQNCGCPAGKECDVCLGLCEARCMCNDGYFRDADGLGGESRKTLYICLVFDVLNF